MPDVMQQIVLQLKFEKSTAIVIKRVLLLYNVETQEKLQVLVFNMAGEVVFVYVLNTITAVLYYIMYCFLRLCVKAPKGLICTKIFIHLL